jgi:DNA-binding XRE family transcriptional regulator
MILRNELRGIIASRGLSQADVAKKLGVTPETFYRKMKIGVFSNLEISAMINLLEIKDPLHIFFTDSVAQ